MLSEPENIASVTRLFRLWSHIYDNPIPQRLFYRRVHRRILRRWQPAEGERVLDVGCGTGLLLNGLAAAYDDLALTGLDLSEPMLSQARNHERSSRSRAPTFVRGSVYEMPFADGAFDVALNSISCHFYLEQVRAFREVQRVLIPGGRFFCAALAARRSRRQAFGRFAIYETEAGLEEHLRQAGFAVVALDRMFPNVVVLELQKSAG